MHDSGETLYCGLYQFTTIKTKQSLYQPQSYLFTKLLWKKGTSHKDVISVTSLAIDLMKFYL